MPFSTHTEHRGCSNSVVYISEIWPQSNDDKIGVCHVLKDIVFLLIIIIALLGQFPPAWCPSLQSAAIGQHTTTDD